MAWENWQPQMDAITRFIQHHWSLEQLKQVAAFNRLGRLRFYDPCGCLLGVTLSPLLHNQGEFPCGDALLPISHYIRANYLEFAQDAEAAFQDIDADENRKSIMDYIFQREIARREAVLLPEPQVQPEEELVCV